MLILRWIFVSCIFACSGLCVQAEVLFKTQKDSFAIEVATTREEDQSTALTIKIESQSSKAPTAFYLDLPNRLAIDIPEASFLTTSVELPQTNVFASFLRIGRHQKFSRLVLDLKKDLKGLSLITDNDSYIIKASEKGASLTENNLIYPLVTDAALIAIDPNKSQVADLHIKNISADALYVSLGIANQDEDQDKHSIRASPKKATFLPGESRIVRISYPDAKFVKKEEHYTLQFHEITEGDWVPRELLGPLNLVLQPANRLEGLTWQIKEGYLYLQNDGNITAWYCVFSKDGESDEDACNDLLTSPSLVPEEKLILPLPEDFIGTLRISYGEEFHNFELNTQPILGEK